VQGTVVAGFTNLKQSAKFSLMILDIFNGSMKFSLSVCLSVCLLKKWLGKPGESNNRLDFVSGVHCYVPNCLAA
jgi:hypothetical protein